MEEGGQPSLWQITNEAGVASQGVIAMCYGMGCRWENYYGECTAPRSVLRYPNDEEACLCYTEDRDESEGEEYEEEE